jgi:hypothetical protein
MHSGKVGCTPVSKLGDVSKAFTSARKAVEKKKNKKITTVTNMNGL